MSGGKTQMRAEAHSRAWCLQLCLHTHNTHTSCCSTSISVVIGCVQFDCLGEGYLCRTSKHSPRCQTRWIFFMVSCSCVSYLYPCARVCVCVRVISWYGIYTQTVYTTHTPHIDSVHPFNTRQRKHLCGKTFTFCSDDCLLSEVLYSHTLTLTHTHARICGVR